MNIRNLLLRLTLQEQMRLQSERWRDERLKLEKLSDEELMYRYIDIKSQYEHQKRFFSLILVASLLSGFSNLWSVLWELAKDVLQLRVYEGEDLSAFFRFSSVLCLILSFTILGTILSYLNFMRKTHRRLLMVEEVKKARV